MTHEERQLIALKVQAINIERDILREIARRVESANRLSLGVNLPTYDFLKGAERADGMASNRIIALQEVTEDTSSATIALLLGGY